MWATGVPAFLLPPPLAVARTLASAAPLLLDHARVTLVEILLGLAGGVLIGGASALLMALLPPLQPWLLPILVLGQTIPVFALAPLLVLWFGYGLASKVVMAILIIYFPVAAALFDGLRRTEPGWLDLARTMGAGRLRTLLRLRLPAALPAFGSGLRIADRGGADRRRGRRVGRLERRARLSDAARQRAPADRPDVRRPVRAHGDRARAVRHGRPAAGPRHALGAA